MRAYRAGIPSSIWVRPYVEVEQKRIGSGSIVPQAEPESAEDRNAREPVQVAETEPGKMTEIRNGKISRSRWVRPETEENRNARENAVKQAAGEGPTIIIGPESAPTYEDARAIVQYVAFRVLLNELDYHGLNELTGNYHAELAGLSEDTIRRAIAEGLE